MSDKNIELPRLTNRERSRKPHGGKTKIYCWSDRDQVRVGEIEGTQSRIRDKKIYAF